MDHAGPSAATAVSTVPAADISPRPASTLQLLLTVCGAGLLVADFCSDLLTCVLFFTSGHLTWGAVTVVWPLLAAIATLLLDGPSIPDFPVDQKTEGRENVKQESVQVNKTSQPQELRCHLSQDRLQQEHQEYRESKYHQQEQERHQDVDGNGPRSCPCCLSHAESPACVHGLQKPEDKNLRTPAQNTEQQSFRGGLLHRYIALFRQQVQPDTDGRSDYTAEERSVSLCHLYQATLQSAPQLVLQLYGVLYLRRNQPFIFVCAATSLANLIWAVARHSRYPSIFPENSSEVENGARSKSGTCYPGNEAITRASTALKSTENISSSSEINEHSDTHDRRDSSTKNVRICHSRSDSGLDNSYRGSSSLPKLIDRNLKINQHCEHKSSSLPSKPGTGYQAMYLSNAFASSGLLDVPVKNIKEHKFGSVLTLKERNLMTNTSNGNVRGGNELRSLSALDMNSCSPSTLLQVLQVLTGLLLLTTRLAALTAAAIMVGPWLYMTTCVHMTVMFVMVVSERPQFSVVLWRDVVMSLTTAVVFCTTITPLTVKSSKWRHAVGHCVLVAENTTASVLLFITHRHNNPHLAVVLLASVITLTFLGYGLLLLSSYLDQRRPDLDTSDLELGCVSSHCIRHSNEATLALPEDSSSAYSGSTDSNYGSSSPSPSSDDCPNGQTENAPLERQTGLLCSVQDLLANMSCLNEDLQLRNTDAVEISHHNTEGALKEEQNGCDTYKDNLLGQHGFLTRNTNVNNEPWNSGRPLSTLGLTARDFNEVHAKESQIDSAKILLSRSFTRDISNYDDFYEDNHCPRAFKSSANYENYPPPNGLMGEPQEIMPSSTYDTNSPSSLERSVTREYDEKLQDLLDATHNVSSLANSSSNSICMHSCNGTLQKQVPQETHTCEVFRWCKSDASTSVLRGEDAQHELTCVSDTDMRLISVPQTSPSSLYSSLNNSESTECDTAIEMKQHSFHRPPSSNVEHSVVRKLSSIRRKLPSKATDKKHDYENVYDDSENMNFESLTPTVCQNTATGFIATNQQTSKPRDFIAERRSSTECLTEGVSSKNNSHAELESVNKNSTNNIAVSQALPLPLPPRTYIIRYPYQHFPLPLLKLSESANHSNNSSNHDYENLPPLNVNRGVFGVRHWKAYLDIEDRVHDYSTYKDKSKINSTASSSLTSDCSALKISGRIRKSIADDGESVLSRSLPDLSNLILEACIEVPEREKEIEKLDTVHEKLPDNVRLLSVLSSLRATKPLRTNSVDDLSNYETIWIDEINEGIKSGNEVLTSSAVLSKISDAVSTEHSSLITTIGDVKTKGSLCNLYYSTMSDLSRRFYSDTLRRQSISFHHQASQNGISACSTDNSFADKETVQNSRTSFKVKKTPALQGISECSEEQPFDIQNAETNTSPFLSTGEAQNMAEVEKEPNKLEDNQVFHPAAAPDDANVPKPKRKFSLLREKFEGQRWTPLKSPLKFHSPAKALQAGLRVFNRPRIHIITPSDDENEIFGGKLTSPFKLKPKIVGTSPSITTNKSENPSIKQTTKVMEHVLGMNIDQENQPGNSLPVTSSHTSTAISSSRMTQQTPMSCSLRTVPKTPKTSTPDNARAKNIRCESSVNSSKSDSIAASAPKHSTPEAVGHHLPQLSTISGLSSVVESPELSRISSVYGPLPRSYSSARGVENGMKRVPLSENVRWGDRVNRMGNMPSMTSIKERENQCHEDSSLKFAGRSSTFRPYQVNPEIHVANANENRYHEVATSRLNPASKNIYTVFHDQQKVLRNNRSSVVHPRLADQCYEDAVFIAPLPVGSYGITNQRSTLTPNSKIFDKRI
ncbi:XK-related protein [Trinorchestia longiramus]|nr:XK-related protein [Trinorchestia longiramus]